MITGLEARAAGWLLEGSTQACFQYELLQPGSKKSPPRFACHAWSDLDEDKQVTHEQLTVTWDPAQGVFDFAAIQRE